MCGEHMCVCSEGVCVCMRARPCIFVRPCVRVCVCEHWRELWKVAITVVIAQLHNVKFMISNEI